MLLTWAMGAVGGLIGGPPGAIALGGLGAAMETAQHVAKEKTLDKANSEPTGVKIHEPVWNAHLNVWETPYTAWQRRQKEAASAAEPTPTRATSSRWEEPVDPDFQ